MTTTVQPLLDRVVVKAILEDKTDGALVIPDSVDRDKPETGMVVAVGGGRRTSAGSLVPMEVAVGDKVLFRKYSPDEVLLDGETHLILAETDIMAVIR